MNTLPEWTDLRFFLELARAGTLSGASRRLDVEHTTVARRIDRLEKELGSTLFDRSREGYELTEMGHALLPHAEAMEGAALAAAEQLGGAEVAAHGVVRWRLVDLAQWLHDEFKLSVTRHTLSRELRAMGYRKLSARPRHRGQRSEDITAFKKTSPPVWRKSARGSQGARP